MQKEALSNSNHDLKKYIFWAVILILLVLSYLIIKSYLVPLISAFLLAYLTFPIYSKLKKTLPLSLSAIICISLVLLIIILPLGAIITGIVQQANFSITEQKFTEILEKISSSPLIDTFNLNLDELKARSIEFLISLLTSAITHLPIVIISIFITLFGMYYILINWSFLSSRLEQYLPFKNKSKIVSELDHSTKGIVHGILLIAIIEFVISIIGFYLSGAKLFLLLPALIFFFAFIPGLGPAAVWVPTAIFYIFTNNVPTAIGVIITGLILSIGVDTFLISKITSKKSKINPLIMLIGILGGIPVFGVFGFIIGPLILSYTLKLLEESMKS